MKSARTWWPALPPSAFWGVALLLFAAGALLISTAFDSQARAVAAGELPVNPGAASRTDIRANNSPSLARNPVREANLVVANRIDTPDFGCALQVSFDGGAHWEPTRIPTPAGEEPKCWAPDAAFGPDGTLYLSFVTLRGRGNVPHAGWVVRSDNGGRTLSAPTKVLGPLAFQVRLAADPTRSGNILLTWLQASEVGVRRFTHTGHPIRSTRSENGGVTWSRPTRVSSPSRARAVAPTPVVGANGQLYVLYLDLGQDRLDYEGGHEGRGGAPWSGHFKLVLARSTDAGRSWAESEAEDRIVPIQRFFVFFPPSPSIAIDPRNGRIYAAFHDARLGDPDVWVWSRPGGSGAWEGPARVNDTPARDDSWQYLPKLGVAPNGRLDVLYYDRRSDPRNVLNEVMLQSSFDSGKDFTPAVRLSSRQFDSRIGFGSPRNLPDLGSRLALISDDRAALAIWADTRSGTKYTNKQDLYSAPALFSNPARLSAPLESILRYGGLALALAGIGLLLHSQMRTSSAPDAFPND